MSNKGLNQNETFYQNSFKNLSFYFDLFNNNKNILFNYPIYKGHSSSLNFSLMFNLLENDSLFSNHLTHNYHSYIYQTPSGSLKIHYFDGCEYTLQHRSDGSYHSNEIDITITLSENKYYLTTPGYKELVYEKPNTSSSRYYISKIDSGSKYLIFLYDSSDRLTAIAPISSGTFPFVLNDEFIMIDYSTIGEIHVSILANSNVIIYETTLYINGVNNLYKIIKSSDSNNIDSFTVNISNSIINVEDDFTNKAISISNSTNSISLINHYNQTTLISYSSSQTIVTDYLGEQVIYDFEDNYIKTVKQDHKIKYLLFENYKKTVEADIYDDPIKNSGYLESDSFYKNQGTILTPQVLSTYPNAYYQNRLGVEFNHDETETLYKKFDISGQSHKTVSSIIYYNLDDFDDVFSYIDITIEFYSNNQKIESISPTIHDTDETMGNWRCAVISAMSLEDYDYFIVKLTARAFYSRIYVYIDAFDTQLANLFFYNNHKLRAALTNNQYTSYFYSDSGNLIDSSFGKAKYNNNNLPIQVEDSLGNLTTYRYNFSNKLISKSISNGDFNLTSTFIHNDDDSEIKETTNGLETTINYNNKYLLSQTTYKDISTSTDLSNNTNYFYSNRDLISNIEFEGQRNHNISYNNNQDIIQTGDYAYQYDNDYKLISVSYYNSPLVTYSYDNNNFITTKSYLNGTYGFTYDDKHRLSTISYNMLCIHRFTYDSYFEDRLIGVDNISFVYDNNNRLVSESNNSYSKSIVFDDYTDEVVQTYQSNNERLISINNSFNFNDDIGLDDFAEICSDMYICLCNNLDDEYRNLLIRPSDLEDHIEPNNNQSTLNEDSNRLSYITRNSGFLHYEAPLGNNMEAITVVRFNNQASINIFSFEASSGKEYGVNYSDGTIRLRETSRNFTEFNIDLVDGNYHIFDLKISGSILILTIDNEQTIPLNINISQLLDKPNSLNVYARTNTYAFFLLPNRTFANNENLLISKTFRQYISNHVDHFYNNKFLPTLNCASNLMLENGEYISLNNTFNSISNLEPSIVEKPIDKDSIKDNFVYDKSINRYVYFNNGQTLKYELPTFNTAIRLDFKVSDSSLPNKIIKIDDSVMVVVSNSTLRAVKDNYPYESSKTIQSNQYYSLTILRTISVRGIITYRIYLNTSLAISISNVTYQGINYLEFNTQNQVYIKDLYLNETTSTLAYINKINNQIKTSVRSVSQYNSLNLIEKESIVNDSSIISSSSYIYETNNDNQTLSARVTSVSRQTINNDDYNEAYRYDAFNRVTNVFDNVSQSYDYDINNQLLSSTIGNNTYSYTYDNRGNILTKTVNNQTTNYQYDNIYKDRLNRYGNNIISYNSNNPLYPSSIDNNGNYKEFYYTGRMLTGYQDTDYQVDFEYNYLNLRTKKRVNEHGFNYEIDYYYDFNNNLIKQVKTEDNVSKSITFLRGDRGLYGFIYEGEQYFYIKNLLGVIYKIIDINGNSIVNYEYDPYGKIVSITGSLANSIGNINPYVYKDYYLDNETGLYYLESRYYSPELCRFLIPDSVDYLDPESINGLNLYAYCGNDPVNYTDPIGHFAISLAVGLVASFAIGFVFSSISQGVQYGWDNINFLQSTVDGVFSLASTALAYTGIGLLGSMVLGAVMSATQYTLDSKVFRDDFSWTGLAVSAGVGFVGGAISGSGAQNPNAIANRDLGKSARTGLKALLTSAEKYGLYSANYARTYSLWGGIVSRAINDAISKNFTTSFEKIVLYTIASYAVSPRLIEMCQNI